MKTRSRKKGRAVMPLKHRSSAYRSQLSPDMSDLTYPLASGCSRGAVHESTSCRGRFRVAALLGMIVVLSSRAKRATSISRRNRLRVDCVVIPSEAGDLLSWLFCRAQIPRRCAPRNDSCLVLPSEASNIDFAPEPTEGRLCCYPERSEGSALMALLPGADSSSLRSSE